MSNDVVEVWEISEDMDSPPKPEDLLRSLEGVLLELKLLEFYLGAEYREGELSSELAEARLHVEKVRDRLKELIERRNRLMRLLRMVVGD